MSLSWCGGGTPLPPAAVCPRRCACCCVLSVVICMTAGQGVVEVHWMPGPGACDVLHRQPAAHSLLTFLSLLRAFLLNVIKRNQTWWGCLLSKSIKVSETATHWLKRRSRSDSMASSGITNAVSSSSRLALEIPSSAPALQSPATGSKVFAVDTASSCRLVYAGALAPDTPTQNGDVQKVMTTDIQAQ